MLDSLNAPYVVWGHKDGLATPLYKCREWDTAWRRVKHTKRDPVFQDASVWRWDEEDESGPAVARLDWS